VINTKQAKRNQKATVSFSSVTQIQKKPVLYYSQHYLPSSTVLDIEESMFQRNNYRERDQTPIPLYTEWLIRHRDGEISTEQLERVRKELEETDTRERSEEHTSELQSRENLVCRLLLEKKNINKKILVEKLPWDVAVNKYLAHRQVEEMADEAMLDVNLKDQCRDRTRDMLLGHVQLYDA